jgi:cytochrome c-type biogenesis protein CcmF
LTKALAGIPRGVYGMTCAHLGVGMFVVGVTFTSAFEVERELRMAPGDTAELSGYEFQFHGAHRVEGPNYMARQGRFEVTQGGQAIATLLPEKRTYLVQTNPMTEAAINSTFFRDLYVALGEPLGGDTWGVRLYYNPFVQWLWLGPLMMALGGVLAASDRRYRVALRRETMSRAYSADAPASLTG